MATDSFNPYHAWLGLDRQLIHPTYYQLLGISENVTLSQQIAGAADVASARVRACPPGEYASQWTDLLEEIAAAKRCLMDPGQRMAYDRQLQERQIASAPPAARPGPRLAAPVAAPAPAPNAFVPPAPPRPFSPALAMPQVAAAPPPPRPPASPLQPPASPLQPPASYVPPRPAASYPTPLAPQAPGTYPTPLSAAPSGYPAAPMPAPSYPPRPVMPTAPLPPMPQRPPYGMTPPTSAWPGAPAAPFSHPQPMGMPPGPPGPPPAVAAVPIAGAAAATEPASASVVAAGTQRRAAAIRAKKEESRSKLYTLLVTLSGALVLVIAVAILAIVAHRGEDKTKGHAKSGSEQPKTTGGTDSKKSPAKTPTTPPTTTAKSGKTPPSKPDRRWTGPGSGDWKAWPDGTTRPEGKTVPAGKDPNDPNPKIEGIEELAPSPDDMMREPKPRVPAADTPAKPDPDKRTAPADDNPFKPEPVKVNAVDPAKPDLPADNRGAIAKSMGATNTFLKSVSGDSPGPAKPGPGQPALPKDNPPANPADGKLAKAEPAAEPNPFQDMEAKPGAKAETPNAEPGAKSDPAKPSDEPNQPKTAEVRALAKALKAARKALSEGRVAQAKDELKKAESLPKRPEHQEKYDRLDVLTQNVEEFFKALAEVSRRLNAGSEIHFGPEGKFLVTVVQITPEAIMIRDSGVNKTFRFDNLPPTLGAVLADQCLDPKLASTPVLKASYLIAHKESDAALINKAREWLEKGKKAGADVGDLEKVIDDTYDLEKDLKALKK